MALTKVSGDILDTGIVVAGVVTATSFDGPITGNVTGSATSISGTPDITVRNISGVGATFTGNVSIGGTLTYQDVTNVDSTGIATARVGLDILSGGLNIVGLTTGLHVSGVSTFIGAINGNVTGNVTGDVTGTASNASGATGDFSIADKIIHTGDTNTAIRFPSADTISFETAGTPRLNITSGGILEHYAEASFVKAGHNYIRIGSSNAGGATLTLDGDSNGDGTGADYCMIKHDTDGHLKIYGDNPANAANIEFYSNSSSETLRITSGGNLKLPDNAKIELGGVQTGAGDLQIYHSAGSDSVIHHTATSGSTLRLRSRGFTFKNQANSQTVATFNEGDACKLFFSGGEKIATTGSGISVTGKVVASGEIESAQDYPTVRPTLDLNFVATNKLDSRVKFFRNSHATYIDKDGIVRIVGDNTPRFDYDPETKECLGLLMEGASSSRLTQSSHITSSGTYHQTITDNYYKGPDDIEGSAREYIHRGDSGSATGGSTSIWANQAIGIANPVSVSFFVKITRGSSMGFELLDNNNNLNSHRVDISGGYISDGSYATVSTNDPGNAEGTTSYQRFPNGWVKVKWENISKSGGNTTTYLQLYLQNHATSTTVNPVGYAMWGFQVENEAFCTSTIIKNRNDVAKERGREVAIIDKEHFADFWNPLEGTAYVDASMPTLYGNSGIPAYSIKHTVNTSHSIAFLRDNNSSPVYHFFNDGSGVLARGAAASDHRYRSALAFKEADINGAINGVASMNQTSAFTMQKFDYMYLGSLNSADNDLHGHLKRFTYYPKKLSDNQLLNITS